jgi:hypothetical protein
MSAESAESTKATTAAAATKTAAATESAAATASAQHDGWGGWGGMGHYDYHAPSYVVSLHCSTRVVCMLALGTACVIMCCVAGCDVKCRLQGMYW